MFFLAVNEDRHYLTARLLTDQHSCLHPHPSLPVLQRFRSLHMGRRQARRKERQVERARCVPRLDMIIDQANFDGSWRRTQALMSHQRQGRNGGSADIICGCDP